MDHDEFDFSDPDLDDLPASTLLQLEKSALHATQQPRPDNTQGYAFEDAHGGLSHGHGDEIINLDDNHGPHHNRLSGGALMDVDEPPQQSQADVVKLLQRIKKLEQEKWRLNQNLQTAQSEASKKAGEAENVRRRADAERRTAELRLQNLQREHIEASEKLRIDRDNAQRQLDEHDAQQAEQMRRMRRPMPARPKPTVTTTASPSGTPKRAQKTLPLGDGFDDEDIVMASPSKRRDRFKAATPKQTHKRKRQALNDSPIQALQLSEPREPSKAPELASFADSRLDMALLRNLWKDESRFNLLQRLLAHRCSDGQNRIFEALAQHSFPSKPDKSLSSIVYDSLSGLRLPSRAHDLALRVCGAFSELWAQCLREQHYAPISLILDAVQFILACEPATIAVDVIETMIPLIITSVDLVATPVLEAANRLEARVAALYSPAQRAMTHSIDVENCLQLLHLIATSCVSSLSSEEALMRFWRAMPHKYVLLLLHRNQPLGQMSLMLRILASSALSNSLGPMGIDARDEAQEQAAVEEAVISRLTNLLGESIERIPDPEGGLAESVEEKAIWQVRLKVLDVLTQFAMTGHGLARLASDHYCIGRLVKYLDYCVASLYGRPLSPTQKDKVASINATMRLVHYLMTRGERLMKNKLKGVEHAYHVALTRITFSDRLVLEEGIESQVIDMAHHILDENVGPEEGEQLLEVFPSANSA
ncbi:hypothetical protein DM02DRAFT_613372 [Periconia macrospinosa]|uniref:DNA repair protein Rad26 n=1 Tax=Periconia macrospinosa TaxID=97972 RepID=A0A2V1DX61_9PLEO|nr:hypothetical protein DM02DRAFT_613372 [Periconia macrospinosa]